MHGYLLTVDGTVSDATGSMPITVSGRLDSATAVAVYVTVRVAASLDSFTANLRAPILVWNHTAYQIINRAPGCELRAPLFQPAAPGSEAAC